MIDEDEHDARKPFLNTDEDMFDVIEDECGTSMSIPSNMSLLRGLFSRQDIKFIYIYHDSSGWYTIDMDTLVSFHVNKTAIHVVCITEELLIALENITGVIARKHQPLKKRFFKRNREVTR